MTTSTTMQIKLQTKRLAVREFIAILTGESEGEATYNVRQTTSSAGKNAQQTTRQTTQGEFVMRFIALRAAAILLAFVFAVYFNSAEVMGQAPQQVPLKDAVGRAVIDLGLEKGSSNLCVLSNAPYAKTGPDPAVTCLDMVQEVTGCSIAQKNLLFYHSPITAPLRIVLFHKGTGEAVVITHGGGPGQSGRLTDPCSPISAAGKAQNAETARITLAPDKVVDPDSYKAILEKFGPSDGFSIASIVNAWAMGAPYEFLKTCEFHNHYCPGVVGGYLMVKLVMEKYPLQKGLRYVWIGSPPKCGDDAVQILLDLTPGKQNCFIKGLTPAQKRQITVEEPLNNVLGILIIWDNAANRGKAVTFKYDWGKACDMAGIKFSDFFPEKGMADPRFFTSRLKGNFALMPYLAKPSEFVTVAKETEVTAEMYVQMISAGSNPYEVVGLTRQ